MTDFAPRKALQSIAFGKLAFDERVVVFLVVPGLPGEVPVASSSFQGLMLVLLLSLGGGFDRAPGKGLQYNSRGRLFLMSEVPRRKVSYERGTPVGRRSGGSPWRVLSF